MDIRVEVETDGERPIVIWWTNHEWSELSIEEARTLYERLQDAVGDSGTFRLTEEQAQMIRDMGHDD